MIYVDAQSAAGGDREKNACMFFMERILLHFSAIVVTTVMF